MEIRYTPLAATAALVLSLIAVAMSVVTLARTEVRAGPAQSNAQNVKEQICINGFAYHMRTTSRDSEYGGVGVLAVIQEPKGEPIYDDNGREQPRRNGPKACSI